MPQMSADKKSQSYLCTSAYICGFIIRRSLCPLCLCGYIDLTSEASTW
jgi:hypothetical protein